MNTEHMVRDLFSYGLYPCVTLILFICGVGVPLPEEAVFLAAGYYGQEHGANVWLLCVCGVAGIMLGDSIPYWVGRKYGMRVLKKRPFSWFLKEKAIDKTRSFFGKHGSKTVFVGRFLAGVRMPTFFMAGSMGVSYWKFAAWDLAGALISCPTSIWLAYTYGKVAERYLRESQPILFTVLGAVILYMVWHVWSHREKPELCEAKALESTPVNSQPTVAPDVAAKSDIPNPPQAK